MSAEDATEFEATIGPSASGEWEWQLHTVNGKWPHSIGRIRMDDVKTSGRTMTKWGARADARRALKAIKRLQTIEPEKVS